MEVVMQNFGKFLIYSTKKIVYDLVNCSKPMICRP